MRALLVILAALVVASPSSAIKLGMIGQAAPKITVYRQSQTTAVVYDARPEMGISLGDTKTTIGALDAIDVRVARVFLNIETMEPTVKPGVYDSVYLAQWDKIVDECRQRGVCLVVAIQCDTLGTDTADAMAKTERAARFAGDMAQRYPSVIYWEIGGNSERVLATVSSADAGKTCGQSLKPIYQAIKAANPAAQIVCGASSPEFLKGVYDSGPVHLFDIVCAESDAKGFVGNASAYRKIMSSSADDTKPLWCLYLDGFEQQALEEAFRLNNDSSLYQKILVRNTGSGEQSAWLLKTKVNSAIDARPRNTVDVVIPAAKPMVPIGYAYKPVGGGVEVHGVVVDSLVPTVIHLMYAPEQPAPVKPGAKPVPQKKYGTPMPDPWDI